MYFIKRIIICIILFSGAFFDASLGNANEAKPLRIAITDVYPPYTILGPDGTAFGLFVDMWNAWSETTGIDVEFVPSGWNDTLKAVKNGDADIHSGLYKNKTRDEYLDFSDPIHVGRTSLHFRISQDGTPSLENMQGKKVGVVKGTYQSQFLAEQHPAVQRISFPGPKEMATALLKGEVDAVISETVAIQATLSSLGLRGVFKEGNETLLKNYVYAAVANGRKDLLKTINEGFKRVPREKLIDAEQRWLAHMSDHFYHLNKEKVPLSAEEKNWIVDNPVSRIAVTTFINPIDIINDKGNYSGLNADILDIIRRKTGLNLVPEFFGKWPDVVENTLNGTVDGAMSFSITKERAKVVNFTSAYAYDPVVIVTQSTNDTLLRWEDLKGKRISIVKGIGFLGDIRKAVEKDLFIVNSEEEGLALLSAKTVDAHISTLILYGNAQKKKYVADLKVASSKINEGGALRIAIHKEKPHLFSIVKKALQSITQDELSGLRDKWLSPRRQPSPDAVLLNSKETAWLKKNPITRIAVLKNWQPYDETNKEGRHVGLHADLLTLINKHLGTNFIPLPFAKWKDAYTATLKGETDGILGLSWTKPREKSFYFSTAYHYKPADLVMRANEPAIHDWDVMDGKKIIVRAKASLIDKIKKDLPNATIIEASSEADALLRLSKGEGDGYLAWVSARPEELANLDLVITAQIDDRQGEFTLGVPKSNPTVASIVQKGINAISQDEWTALKTRWLTSQEAGQLGLSAKEKQWLKEHPSIDIAMMDAWPPISYTDTKGRPKGLNVALVNMLNKKLDGVLRLRPGGFKENYQAVKNKEVPALLDITPLPGREEFFNFTESYLSIPHIYVARRDAPFINNEKDLIGKTLALERGFGNVKWFKENYPKIIIKEYADTSTALDAVSRSEADAYAGNRAVALHIIEQELIHNLRLHGRVKKKPVSLNIGTRKDWPILRDILDKTISSLSDEERRSVFQSTLPSRVARNQPHIILSDKERNWLKKHKTVRVMAGTWAPFHFVENGRAQGMALDYVSWALENLGITPEFVPIKWHDALESISKGEKIDLLPTIAHSVEREKLVQFSDPYLSYPRVIFSRKNSGYQSLYDLNAKTIAVEKNFITEKLLQNDFPEIKLHIVDTSKAALEAVSFGQADAYVSNMAVGSYLTEQLGLSNLEVTGQTPYKQDVQSMGVRKDWPELASLLNKALVTMPAAEKRAIRQKWLGQERIKTETVNKVTLSAKEQTWVDAHPVIRVHNEKGWAPFNFFEDGKPKGFSIEFIRLLAEKIGVRVDFITGPTWNDFLGMVRHKTLDVMLNIVRTPKREEYILFTEPYVNNPPMVVVQTGSDIQKFEDLKGRLVCIPEGFFYQEILEKNYPDISLVLSQDQSQCLRIVSSGRADATIGGLAIQDHLIKRLFLSNLVIKSGIEDEAFSNELSIGIRNDWPILQSLLQKAMVNVSEEEIRPIRERWISKQATQQRQAEPETDSFTMVFVIGGTAIGLILLLTLVREIMSRLSKRDVSRAYESREVKGTGLLVVGIFLTVVILAAWLMALQNEKDTRHTIGLQLQTVLNTTHEAIRTWLKSETRYIDRIANDPELLMHVEELLKVKRTSGELKNSLALAKVREWFDRHSKGRETQGFFIIAPDKVSIGSKRDKNLGTLNLISKIRGERLSLAFDGETQLIPPIPSDVQIKSKSGLSQVVEPTMFLAAPIFNQDKVVIAVLTLRYDPVEDFTRIAQLGQVGTSGETYVFDKKAILVTDSRFETDLQGIGLLEKGRNAILNLRLGDPGRDLMHSGKLKENPTTLPLTYMAERALKGENGSNINGYRDYRGVTVLGAWTWDNKLGVGLATELDENEAMATFWALRLTMAIVLGVTVVVALTLTGLSVWIGQSANRSLRNARDSLEQDILDRTRELNFQKFALDKHAIVSATDADGLITYVNDRFVEITGYSRKEMMGKNHRFLKSGKHNVEFYEDMWETITAGNVWHGELCNRNKDGAHIWLAASIIPFMGEGGKPERFISIRTDITERKLAEQKIKISESRMRAIIDNAVDGIVVINAQGIVQSFSPAAEKIFGYTEDEVISQNVNMLMPPAIAHIHDDILSEYLAGISHNVVGNNREVTGMRKDGTEFPMDLAVGETVVDDEQIFTGIIRDISSRKEAEEELQSNRNQLHDILSNVQQGVVLFDQNKCLVTWNKHYPDIINVDEEFLHPGMKLYDLTLILSARGEYGETEDLTQEAHDRVESLWNGEARSDLSFGDERIYDAHSVRTSDGRLVITYTDISRRKANEEIIAQSMKLIQESISYASRIQKSVLPTEKELSEILADNFLIWEPKDIVGGDIYLLRHCANGTLLTLVDCTGHGVPGAFMTMVVTGALDQALVELPDASPAILLTRMNQLVKTVLSQIDDQSGSDDGFECGMCLLDPLGKTIAFAGARFELWTIQNDTLNVIKGDKVGIGYRSTPFDQGFTSQNITVTEDISFYMTSDGMVDQIGGDRKRGYGKRRIKKVLLDSARMNMAGQKDFILKQFFEYQGDEVRRDDLSFIGFKLQSG